ncbi:MAG: MotA/TolQ/ExbB proton channel family protein [Planctomycetia bacterium]|nr:MotA/TolQ/ExbB proton channel family protein [Planctomycetia bacterium]
MSYGFHSASSNRKITESVLKDSRTEKETRIIPHRFFLSGISRSFFLGAVLLILFFTALPVGMGKYQTPESQPLDLSVLDGALTGEKAAPSANPVKNTPVENSLPPTGSKSADPSAPASSAAGNPTAESPTGIPGPKDVPSAVPPRSAKVVFRDLIKAGGFIGIILLILSIIALSIVIQILMYLRRKTLFPEELQNDLSRLLETGKIRQAAQTCAKDPSLLARILHKGLSEYQGKWDPLEKTIEESISEESAALYRKAEYLSVIGNIAPMLGLLGTVIGMVIAFGELAVSDGLGRNLAQGIYFALVTTVDGLVVAIPTLVAFALINNRIAQRITDLVHHTERILRPLKKLSGTPLPAPEIPSRPAGTPPIPPGFERGR